MYYSKTTGGFYTPEIHGSSIPSDAVLITDTEYRDLLNAQVAGKLIKGDANGVPIAVDPPPITHAEMVAAVLADARSQRLPILSILDGLQISAVVTSDTLKAQAIETAKQGLRDITGTDLSACTSVAGMQLEIFKAYKAIALAAPASVQVAFNSLVPA